MYIKESVQLLPKLSAKNPDIVTCEILQAVILVNGLPS